MQALVRYSIQSGNPFIPSAINERINEWNQWSHIKNEAGVKPETEHFGLAVQLLPCRPRGGDCSGIVWQGNKWFSVTEPFSHGDHQQLVLSFTSHFPLPCKLPFTHWHDIDKYFSFGHMSYCGGLNVNCVKDCCWETLKLHWCSFILLCLIISPTFLQWFGIGFKQILIVLELTQVCWNWKLLCFT